MAKKNIASINRQYVRLTEGKHVKGGVNSDVSQIITRPSPPTPITKNKSDSQPPRT
jgi:hypothetical protein